MKQKDQDAVGRRSLIAGVGIAAAGLVASTATKAQSSRRSARSNFSPTRNPQDAWFDELPGDHRVFVDSASANGGAEAVGYSGNLFRATASAYADEDAELAIVVCFRHMSTPFGYNDRMWEKYGEVFNSLMQYPDPGTGAAPKLNLLNSATSQGLGNRGTLIDSLADRGVQFAVCSMATQGISGFVAQQMGGDANAVAAELMANGVRNSRFVSAGVMALTRAQEYGYSVLIAG
jgi:intracellular sulfur oxidation DsrE/DsrF family protein